MKTKICDMLGIEVPIFGFSHCRDVVAEVSLAGGFGVFGAASYSPEELEIELHWLDEKLEGHTYGVNVLMAASVEEGSSDELAKRIPEESRRFVEELDKRLGVPPLRENAPPPSSMIRGLEMRGTHGWARPQVEVALRHNIKFLSSALGPFPADIVAEAHSKGVLIGGTVGIARHAQKHIAAGADILVTAGMEGAGHNGGLSTMVMVPEIVDAAGDVPVLAAGGIANGRQVAAAFALGAQGVWLGSVWLATTESDFDPAGIELILKASSSDTIRTKCWSGKPTRFLRNPWMEAWEEPGAPEPLPTPLQRILVTPSQRRITAAGMTELLAVPVGQVVGQIKSVRRVRDVVFDLIEEYGDAMERLHSLDI